MAKRIFETLCEGELARLFEQEFERIADSFVETEGTTSARTLTVKLVFKQKQGYPTIDLVVDVHTKMPSVKRVDVMQLQEDERQAGRFEMIPLGASSDESSDSDSDDSGNGGDTIPRIGRRG